MVISSRTPEGSPNRCPVCNSFVKIEPSLPFGDAPCPACGQLLWFVTAHSEQRFFVNEEGSGLLKRLAENLGIDADKLLADPSFRHEIGADSLDLVELMMELEEEEHG